MVRAKASHQCYPGSNPSVDAVREGLNGVNRQPSNGLIFNRRPSKKVIFYREPSKMHSNINLQSVSRYCESDYFN